MKMSAPTPSTTAEPKEMKTVEEPAQKLDDIEEEEEGPEEDIPSFDTGDIRSILLAERVEAIFRDVRENKPLPGKEKQFEAYRKMGIIRNLAKAVLLIQVLFSKPQWCKELGSNIDENCIRDTKDITYFRSSLPVIDTGLDLPITIACLLFLTISRYYKLSINARTIDSISTMISCSVLTLSYILLTAFHGFGLFKEVKIQDVISMLFILIYKYTVAKQRPDPKGISASDEHRYRGCGGAYNLRLGAAGLRLPG